MATDRVSLPWLPAGAGCDPSVQWSIGHGTKFNAFVFAPAGLSSPATITTSWQRLGDVVTSVSKGTWARNQWSNSPSGADMAITGIFPPLPNDYGELAWWSFSGLDDTITPARARLSGDGALLYVYEHTPNGSTVLTRLTDTMIMQTPGATEDIFSLQLTYTTSDDF